MRRFEGPEEFLLSLRTAQVQRRPKSLVYLQSLKWVAQARERVRWLPSRSSKQEIPPGPPTKGRPPVTSVPTDEIYEKYLQKAIAEINDLGREIDAEAAGRVPVLGSGHPLADVLLLKYPPQPTEVQEGVAFYGRAGQAVLKSLQRLRVDPMAVYGTNCLKFAQQDEDEARPWLTRELHVVQPKLVVVMGEEALRFLNELDFPLAQPGRGRAPASSSSFTPATEALYVPDIDASLDEQSAKTDFWNAFKLLGAWWAELPPY